MITPGISGMPGMWPRTQNSSVRDVLVADADAALDVVVDDRRELLHFEALRIVAADFLDVRHDVIEVVLGEIEDQIFAGQQESLARQSRAHEAKAKRAASPR